MAERNLPNPAARVRDARLYGIVDLGYVAPKRLRDVTLELLADGQGVQVLQLRAKDHSPDRIARWAAELIPLAHRFGVPFVINDHLEVAMETGGDGVHLGQDDGPLAAARSRIGEGRLIGRSTHSPAQARAAWEAGADYIGFGPLHATPTKPGRPAIGLDDIEMVQGQVGLPVFCIGGVRVDELASLMERGVRRAVIVGDLLNAGDVRAQVLRARGILGGRE